MKYINNMQFYQNIEQIKRPHFTDTVHLTETCKTPLLQFTPYEQMKFIGHGFSTKLGGVSSGIYESMNLSFTLEDNPENVSKNFEIIAKALGMTPEQMVYSKQTHTTNVMKVDASHAGMGVVRERNFDNIDGLITNESGICLVTSYADCVPLFFVNPKEKCIGTSHSGWRGTVGNIAENTIKLMHKEYHSNPKDLIVFIGPSICANCYEVSEDVATQFFHAFSEDEAQNIVLPGKAEGKFQLNLQMANYYHMIH